MRAILEMAEDSEKRQTIFSVKKNVVLNWLRVGNAIDKCKNQELKAAWIDFAILALSHLETVNELLAA